MQQKKFVDYELTGNSRRYFPLVKKEDYFSDQVGDMVERFFDNSALKFASFFAKKGGLSDTELHALHKMISDQIKNQDKNQDHD